MICKKRVLAENPRGDAFDLERRGFLETFREFTADKSVLSEIKVAELQATISAMVQILALALEYGK